MAEATPKLERILEWMGLGSIGNESNKELRDSIVLEQTNTDNHVSGSGSLATGKVRPDRKQLIAVKLRESVILLIDEALSSVWKFLFQ